MKRNGRPRSEWLSGPITPSEYQEALMFFVQVTQRHYYSDEFHAIGRGDQCSKSISHLSPFVTSTGYLRVGGRLRFSALPFKSRHPLLIPKESRLATLLCDHFHRYSGHGGPRLIQSLLQREFWIVGLKNLIRRRSFRCSVCFRLKPRTTLQPPMADLPAVRVSPSRCFTNTSVDFGGPFLIRYSSRRNAALEKFYIALFVCMSSKAVHVEYVSSLSSAAFLAAFDRFVARRGLPARIYSDNGRNFRGASRELHEIYRFLADSSENFQTYLAERRIEWIFQPPYAPNFSGLVEAGIKSVKFHLKRIVGEQILNVEEFNTVLTRVEAILNSRPLTAISSSPDDYEVLTPGHFLVGGPLLACPEIDIHDIPMNRLDRWKLTRQIVQAFWKRWCREYLHTQLHRPKWTKPMQAIDVGDLVYWYSPQHPPTHWPLGRVCELLPGGDGQTRVARITSRNGVVMRPLNRLIPLPKDD